MLVNQDIVSYICEIECPNNLPLITRHTACQQRTQHIQCPTFPIHVHTCAKAYNVMYYI